MKEVIIKVGDKHFKPLLDEHVIALAVQEMAAKINEDYKGQKPLILVVLNGSFMLVSDLAKHLTIECEFCFIKASSYKGTERDENVTVESFPVFSNREVIIIEDIIDTGNTVIRIIEELWSNGAPNFKIATLLFKPKACQHPDLHIDYIGIEIENEFVVGYGMDYNDLGRNLPEIYQAVENKTEPNYWEP